MLEVKATKLVGPGIDDRALIMWQRKLLPEGTQAVDELTKQHWDVGGMWLQKIKHGKRIDTQPGMPSRFRFTMQFVAALALPIEDYIENVVGPYLRPFGEIVYDDEAGVVYIKPRRKDYE